MAFFPVSRPTIVKCSDRSQGKDVLVKRKYNAEDTKGGVRQIWLLYTFVAIFQQVDAELIVVLFGSRRRAGLVSDTD